jgi:hypothetical protein
VSRWVPFPFPHSHIPILFTLLSPIHSPFLHSLIPHSFCDSSYSKTVTLPFPRPPCVRQFYSRYLVPQSNGFKGRTERGHTPRLERAAERRCGRVSQLSAPSLEDLNSDSRSEHSDSECDSGDLVPVPAKVQIVDQETQSGVKPHTVYVILSWWEGDEGKSKTMKVKRRFKEFAELDTRLRQFYADLQLPPLPSKRTLRNMDSSFVAGRSRDLESYLQALLQLPPISSSHLLSSFLSNTSDPSLFMPDSMGERAGKIIKSVTVPGRNKEKGLLLTDLLQRLVQTTETVSPQPSEEVIERVAMTTRQWEEKTETYRRQLEGDLSHSQTSRYGPTTHLTPMLWYIYHTA